VSVEDTVHGLWKALSVRDFELAKTYLADDCIYFDVPVGPAAAARGPEDIEKRIRIAWDALSHYENHDGLMISNGCDVMYEHSETWQWATGEKATLPFVSVHPVRLGTPCAERQDHPVEGLLGHGRAGQPRAAELDGRLRDRRHVLGVRRNRPGLTPQTLQANRNFSASSSGLSAP
jgi:hypothetical protein